MERVVETTTERSFLSNLVMYHRGSKVAITMSLELEMLILNQLC